MQEETRKLTALELEEVRKITELVQFIQLEMGQLQFQLREIDEFRADIVSKIDEIYSTYQSAINQNKRIAERIEEQYGKDCKIDLETGQIN